MPPDTVTLKKPLAFTPSLFHVTKAVDSEITYKVRTAADATLTYHAQIGFREFERTLYAWKNIHDRVVDAGYRMDRYGLCLDWSMGYPATLRDQRPKGTGLILDHPDQLRELTSAAPVAAHFGDFVLGMPGALENTKAALAAGSAAIGNLGQYFTFRLPYWDDEVATTEATVQALQLIVSQPAPVLVHSNLDDGFAAVFTDLSSSIAAILLERYVVEDLLGGHLGHCYGHTFSDPLSRFAFQRALVKLGGAPGTMIYGNTTSYGPNHTANFGALAGYMTIDIIAQKLAPTGHALNPVPVTEADRIPDIDEIVDAHIMAQRLAAQLETPHLYVSVEQADLMAEHLLRRGHAMYQNVLDGLEDRDVDLNDPFHVLLALKRLGGRQLEQLYGGTRLEGDVELRGAVPSPQVSELKHLKQQELADLSDADKSSLMSLNLTACVATTDVHEFGKLFLEDLFRDLNMTIIDGGVSVDPEALATSAVDGAADLIALSTYNGIALDYAARLKAALEASNADIPIFIGGKLNQIPEASNSALPVDVTEDLLALGVTPCPSPKTLFQCLVSRTKGDHAD